MLIWGCGPEISMLGETFGDIVTAILIRYLKRRKMSKIIRRHIKGTLRFWERQQLENWVTESEENMQCFLKLTNKTFEHKK